MEKHEHVLSLSIGFRQTINHSPEEIALSSVRNVEDSSQEEKRRFTIHFIDEGNRYFIIFKIVFIIYLISTHQHI